MWGRDTVLHRMVRLIVMCERGRVPDLGVIAARLEVHERTARRYLLAYERVTNKRVDGWRRPRGI